MSNTDAIGAKISLERVRMNCASRSSRLAVFRDREHRTRATIEQIIAPHVVDAPATARQLIAIMQQGLEVQWLHEDCSFDLVAQWGGAAVRNGVRLRAFDGDDMFMFKVASQRRELA